MCEYVCVCCAYTYAFVLYVCVCVLVCAYVLSVFVFIELWKKSVTLYLMGCAQSSEMTLQVLTVFLIWYFSGLYICSVDWHRALVNLAFIYIYIIFRRCPRCNGYHRRKWTRLHEFKSWTRLIAFHIALIPLGKVWIQLFSLQLWVNSRAG